MKTRIGRYGAAGLFLMMLVLVSYGSVRAEQGKLLNRSLYVPVAFRVCEHLAEASLYIEDQPVGALPIERIFLFTYYPDLKRLLPKVTHLRVEGVRTDDNSPFIGRLALDPTAIYTADKRVALDFERAKKQLSYRIDSRYKKVNLLMRCDTECSRSNSTLATASLNMAHAARSGADEKP